MEELEKELLAVTEHKARSDAPRRSDDDDDDDSQGEFAGVVDSDPNDDDDDDDDDPLHDDPDDDEDSRRGRRGMHDDDDDDDDEYGIGDDDDDDDYTTSRPTSSNKKSSSRASGSAARKRRPSSSAAKSRTKTRPRGTDPKRNTSSKSRASAAASDDDPRWDRMDVDDDDDHHHRHHRDRRDDEEHEEHARFSYKYDEDGYGDAADRDLLSKMSEVDRETLLTDRKDDRNKQFLIWQKKRQMAREANLHANANRSRSAPRSKLQSKSDALDALAAQKRKRTSRSFDIGSDADSELDAPSHPTKPGLDSKSDTKLEADLLVDKKGPDLRYSDLVTMGSDATARTSPLVLRRETLIQLSQQPYFERVIQGLFVRLKVGATPTGEGSYLLCRIDGVRVGRVYGFAGISGSGSDLRTNLYLVLVSGKQRRTFEIRLISSSHPTEREFNTYVDRARSRGVEIPRREEVEKLLKSSRRMIVENKVSPNDEEVKKHMANMELVYPARVNWTKKRTETETALGIKRQEFSNARDTGDEESADKFEREVGDLEIDLKKIREMESKYTTHERTSNAQVFQNLARRNMRLNATNKSLEARRRSARASQGDTDQGRGEGGAGEYEAMVAVGKGWSAGDDWRKELKSWEPSAKRQKISENAMSAPYAVMLAGIEDFTTEKLERVRGKKGTFVPPGIDAVYEGVHGKKVELPQGARIISVDEWSKQRAA